MFPLASFLERNSTWMGKDNRDIFFPFLMLCCFPMPPLVFQSHRLHSPSIHQRKDITEMILKHKHILQLVDNIRYKCWRISVSPPEGIASGNKLPGSTRPKLGISWAKKLLTPTLETAPIYFRSRYHFSSDQRWTSVLRGRILFLRAPPGPIIFSL